MCTSTRCACANVSMHAAVFLFNTFFIFILQQIFDGEDDDDDDDVGEKCENKMRCEMFLPFL